MAGAMGLRHCNNVEDFRRLAKRLEDEEHLRQLAVRELAHRLKNKIATIQAIISVQLRDQPQVRADILAGSRL